MSALQQFVPVELCSERFDRIRRETEQILERWDNRLVFPFRNVLECYLRGDLTPHVHFKVSCADESRSQLVCALFQHCHSPKLRTNTSVNCEEIDDKLPMFIGSVQVMDNPKGMPMWCSSLVRLQPINFCQRTDTGDSLYFSAISAKFLRVAVTPRMPRFLVENWEVN